MEIERNRYSLSGDLPLPLVLRRAYEIEGEKFLRVWNVFDWLRRYRFSEKFAPLALPAICILSGISLEKIGSTQKTILEINELREEEIPSRLSFEREKFLKRFKGD